jgi:hypothetical protein
MADGFVANSLLVNGVVGPLLGTDCTWAAALAATQSEMAVASQTMYRFMSFSFYLG